MSRVENRLNALGHISLPFQNSIEGHGKFREERNIFVYGNYFYGIWFHEI